MGMIQSCKKPWFSSKAMSDLSFPVFYFCHFSAFLSILTAASSPLFPLCLYPSYNSLCLHTFTHLEHCERQCLRISVFIYSMHVSVLCAEQVRCSRWRLMSCLKGTSALFPQVVIKKLLVFCYVSLISGVFKKQTWHIFAFSLSLVVFTACKCNSHANVCHVNTGKCFCTTKGVKGDQCQLWVCQPRSNLSWIIRQPDQIKLI